MKSKPTILILLAALQIIAPIGNLFIGYILSNVSWSHYWLWLSTIGTDHFYLDFLVVPFIAAFAIYSVKIWSIPLFMATVAWGFLNQSGLNMTYDSSLTKPMLVLGAVLNFALVGYFLFSEHKKIYLTKRLRWWESLPRYQVQWDATFSNKSSAVIRQFSSEGIFIETTQKYNIGDLLNISFKFEQNSFTAPVKVVNRIATSGGTYGLQFHHLSILEQVKLRFLAKLLDRKGYERRPERARHFEDISKWFKDCSLR